MKLKKALELICDTSYLISKKMTPSLRYDLYIYIQSLSTEWEDLDYKAEKKDMRKMYRSDN